VVFVLMLEWVWRSFKKALDGNPCTIETQILNKNVSHIVQFTKNKIKDFFHFFWIEITP